MKTTQMAPNSEHQQYYISALIRRSEKKREIAKRNVQDGASGQERSVPKSIGLT